ncbi:MAG: septal ring lytic transglycosylase RlpA family protein [Acidiferrobacterales bacterium]
MRKILPLILVAVLLTACGGLHRKGGYYEDDGPPKRTRVDLSKIPSALPRVEPLSQHGNNPYTVSGKMYFPLSSAKDYRERGIASWYGKKFHGKQTSSRERYDMYAMTAAHKVLPLPTYVQVRNLHNGRVVVVRVNDRGPFLRNRVIDLSYAAAAKLDMLRTGTALVEVRAIDGVEPYPTTLQTAGVQAATEHSSSGQPSAPRLYLQVGAFTSWENAVRLRARLNRAQLGLIHIQSELQDNVRFYRVRVGPLASIAESDRLAQRAAEYGVPDAHVIVE